MGKKKPRNRGPDSNSGPSQPSITLRQESTGKKQAPNINAKSRLKLDHLKNLALWASAEASIPSLSAFFGQRYASSAENAGVPPDPSLFYCQRCESILQPGSNCTVRIEKNKEKVRRWRKKQGISTQNNVVYKCHFCSQRNLKRGTPRGYMKEICPMKIRRPQKASEPVKPIAEKSLVLQKVMENNIEAEKVCVESNVEVGKVDKVTDFQAEKSDVVIPIIKAEDNSVLASPSTPLPRPVTTLLDAKKRKRNRSSSKKVAESNGSSAAVEVENTISAPSKRKRKSWTSLKEIAESSEHNKNQKFTNLTIPFFI